MPTTAAVRSAWAARRSSASSTRTSSNGSGSHRRRHTLWNQAPSAGASLGDAHHLPAAGVQDFARAHTAEANQR